MCKKCKIFVFFSNNVSHKCNGRQTDETAETHIIHVLVTPICILAVVDVIICIVRLCLIQNSEHSKNKRKKVFTKLNLWTAATV